MLQAGKLPKPLFSELLALMVNESNAFDLLLLVLLIALEAVSALIFSHTVSVWHRFR